MSIALASPSEVQRASHIGSFMSTLSGPVLRDSARLSQRCPPIARYGVLVSQHGQLGAIPPPPFSERLPLGEYAKWRCDTPPLKRGISAILARYPMKTRQMGAIPPSAIRSRKGIARYGGVSRTGPLSEHHYSEKDNSPETAAKGLWLVLSKRWFEFRQIKFPYPI